MEARTFFLPCPAQPTLDQDILITSDLGVKSELWVSQRKDEV